MIGINVEHQCNEKDCKDPIWIKNPLLYLQCEHPKCRNCLVKVFKGQEWTEVCCDKCGKDEAQVKNLLKSVDSCIFLSQITEVPKEKIKEASFVCQVHEKQKIKFFCSLCNHYVCKVCKNEHSQHRIGYLQRIEETQILDKLNNILQDLEKSIQRFMHLKKNLKEICEKQRQADSYTISQIIVESLNIFTLYEYLEKQKKSETVYIQSMKEECAKKQQLEENLSEVSRLLKTDVDLRNQIENLSNEKEQLWKEKLNLQKENEKLVKLLQEQQQLIDHQQLKKFEKMLTESQQELQKDFDECPLQSDKAINTFKRLSGLSIKEIQGYNQEYKPKQLKKIENISLDGWFYRGAWDYYGEVEINEEVPSGVGRAVARDGSRFIDCFFLNGQCHGWVRLILKNGNYIQNDFINGKKVGKEIGFHENGNQWYETNFQDNIQSGKRINYSKNGIKLSEKYYQNDQLNGESVYFNEQGSQIKKEFYENGVLV